MWIGKKQETRHERNVLKFYDHFLFCHFYISLKNLYLSAFLYTSQHHMRFPKRKFKRKSTLSHTQIHFLYEEKSAGCKGAASYWDCRKKRIYVLLLFAGGKALGQTSFNATVHHLRSAMASWSGYAHWTAFSVFFKTSILFQLLNFKVIETKWSKRGYTHQFRGGMDISK